MRHEFSGRSPWATDEELQNAPRRSPPANPPIMALLEPIADALRAAFASYGDSAACLDLFGDEQPEVRVIPSGRLAAPHVRVVSSPSNAEAPKLRFGIRPNPSDEAGKVHVQIVAREDFVRLYPEAPRRYRAVKEDEFTASTPEEAADRVQDVIPRTGGAGPEDVRILDPDQGSSPHARGRTNSTTLAVPVRMALEAAYSDPLPLIGQRRATVDALTATLPEQRALDGDVVAEIVAEHSATLAEDHAP
jgi:hypothetical protein